MWRHRVLGSVALLLLLLTLVQPFTLNQIAEDAPPPLGGIEDPPGPEKVHGGIEDWPGAENDLGVVDLAHFAISEHNSNTNAVLEFRKVVKVKQQVVAGWMYYITIQVSEGWGKQLYEAKVWKKPWPDSNPRQLVEFKPAEDKLCSLLRNMPAFLPGLNRAGCIEYK
ncbi:cysteine proteinase inhibitor-like [Aegilops tauschii subsp. strangulata]|uniref:Cysteine proteinase inhibitor n=1 Tax=Aegilops tauschii TaxID=37682 RepID=R7WDN9_AEGTA|nr:cysteine proteinase inhibitor-like [Aegilops tauschii subsp. strangulata]